MFKNWFQWLKEYFFTHKSLDTILGTFNKVHNELEDFVDREQNKHDELRQTAATLHTIADGKAAQIEAANRVRGKINDLIS